MCVGMVGSSLRQLPNVAPAWRALYRQRWRAQVRLIARLGVGGTRRETFGVRRRLEVGSGLGAATGRSHSSSWTDGRRDWTFARRARDSGGGLVARVEVLGAGLYQQLLSSPCLLFLLYKGEQKSNGNKAASELQPISGALRLHTQCFGEVQKRYKATTTSLFPTPSFPQTPSPHSFY